MCMIYNSSARKTSEKISSFYKTFFALLSCHICDVAEIFNRDVLSSVNETLHLIIYLQIQHFIMIITSFIF